MGSGLFVKAMNANITFTVKWYNLVCTATLYLRFSVLFCQVPYRISTSVILVQVHMFMWALPEVFKWVGHIYTLFSRREDMPWMTHFYQRCRYWEIMQCREVLDAFVKEKIKCEFNPPLICTWERCYNCI